MTVSDNIDVIEGLEPIRRRTSMYLGTAEPGISMRDRLAECVFAGVCMRTPHPAAARLVMWRRGALTVAFDGEPFAVGQATRLPRGEITHPAIYHLFMRMLSDFYAGAIVNALSERLVVSTIHEGHRYRASFSRGGLVGLLNRLDCAERLGSSWLTFAPDRELLSGDADETSTRAVVERTKALVPDVDCSFVDRTSDEADWA